MKIDENSEILPHYPKLGKETFGWGWDLNICKKRMPDFIHLCKTVDRVRELLWELWTEHIVLGQYSLIKNWDYTSGPMMFWLEIEALDG